MISIIKYTVLSYNFSAPKHRYFADFQTDPVAELHVRPRFVDRFSPFQKCRASRYSVLEGCFSFPLCPTSNNSALLASFAYSLKRTVITFVLITLFVHSICRCFRSPGRNSVKEKQSLGLRYLPIAVTSAPKPEVLLNLKSFLVLIPLIPLFLLFTSFFSFSLMLRPRFDFDLVSLHRISYPTDHSYESYFGLLDRLRLVQNSKSFR